MWVRIVKYDCRVEVFLKLTMFASWLELVDAVNTVVGRGLPCRYTFRLGHCISSYSKVASGGGGRGVVNYHKLEFSSD